MVCLGLEPEAAGWKAQTNPLSYGGTPPFNSLYICNVNFMWEGDSGTRWLDYLAMVGHLGQLKFAKVNSKFCHILNKHSKNAKDF